jgi:ComEC/Rec2-related protein
MVLDDSAKIRIHVPPKTEVRFSGVIVSTPKKNDLGLHFFFQAQRVFSVSDGKYVDVKNMYQVIVPGFSGVIPLSQTPISLKGTLSPLKELQWDQILKMHGISAKLWVPPSQLWCKNPGRETWIIALEKRLRNALGQTTLEEASQDLLLAILLGDKKGLSRDLKQSLIHVNVFHIFAISGAHFVLLGHVIYWILGFLGVQKPWRIFFAIPLLWIFLALVQFPPSACRAFLMVSLFWLSSHFYRSAHLLSGIGVSGILLLVWDPYNHNDPGFILSYVAVIALLGPGLEMHKHFKRFWRPWAEKYAMDPKFFGMLKIMEKCITASLFSLAAWLGTAPLVIHYFKVFSFVSILSNLIATVVVEWILICTLLAVFFGQLWGLFAEAYAQTAVFLAKALTKTMVFLETLPGAYTTIFNFDVLDLLFWYAVLFSGFEMYRLYIERVLSRRERCP